MRLEDKIRELSPEKVPRYVARQLSLGQIQPVLGLFPGILEQLPEQAEALEKIHQRALKKEALLAEAQPTEMDVSQINCPGCGAVLHRARPDARAIACGYCGTRFEPRDPQGSAAQLQNPQRHRPWSFLRLGMTGRVRGQACQVVGRMVWHGTCYEWDSEDKSWESTAWRYEEWLLLNDNRKFLYLCHDTEGLSIANEFIPSNPGFPKQRVRTMTLEKGRRESKVEEHGDYKLKFFEGEFGWIPEIGERVKTAEYRKGKEILSAEARIDPQSRDPTEVEFFRTLPYSPRELLTDFNRQHELAELDRRARVAGQFRRWRWASFATAAIVLMIGLITGTPGNRLLAKTLSFEEIGPDGAVAGPVELSDTGRVHRLQLQANFRDNSWAWVGAELLDAERNSINAMSGDFWRESGYDDGHWSESDLSATEHFRLTQPGTYFVRLQLDPGTAGTGTVNVSVYERTVLGRYYGICAGAAFLLGLSLLRGVRTDDLVLGLRRKA